VVTERPFFAGDQVSSRRFRRAVSRGPKNNIWSVVLIDELIVDAAGSEGDIVNSTDLQASATGFQRFTLLRIRGWLSFSKAVTSQVATNLMMIIYVTDSDATGVGALNATTYSKEDVLWTYGLDYAANGAGAVEAQTPITVNVDVKAMRKIDTSRDVRFSVVASSAGLIKMSGILRGLVRKGGN